MESGMHQLLAELQLLERAVRRAEVAVDGARKAGRTATDTRQRAAAARRKAHRMRDRLSLSARPNSQQTSASSGSVGNGSEWLKNVSDAEHSVGVVSGINHGWKSGPGLSGKSASAICRSI